MSIVRRPHPSRDEVALARGQDLGLGAPDLEALEEEPEALGVDPDAVPDGLDLGVALDRARMVEADVPGDELDAALLERREVADGHDVVEAEDAHPLPAAVTAAVAQPLPGPGRRSSCSSIQVVPCSPT